MQIIGKHISDRMQMTSTSSQIETLATRLTKVCYIPFVVGLLSQLRFTSQHHWIASRDNNHIILSIGLVPIMPSVTYFDRLCLQKIPL